MCETEKLIKAVQKQPSLWDVLHADYHNRDVKEIAWAEVCREVHKKWDELNATEHLNRCNELKKKWTHVRDYYRKNLMRVSKKKLTEMKSRKMKKYIYANMLDFLEPIINQKRIRPVSKLSNNEGDSSENASEECDTDDDITQVGSSDPLKQTPLKGPFLTICNNNIKQEIENTESMAFTIEEEVPIKFEKEPRTAIQMSSSDEDDRNFLLSFRGDMRSMTPGQKLDFKLGMVKLIKKIVTNEMNE